MCLGGVGWHHENSTHSPFSYPTTCSPRRKPSWWRRSAAMPALSSANPTGTSLRVCACPAVDCEWFGVCTFAQGLFLIPTPPMPNLFIPQPVLHARQAGPQVHRRQLRDHRAGPAHGKKMCRVGSWLALLSFLFASPFLVSRCVVYSPALSTPTTNFLRMAAPCSAPWRT